MGENLLKFSILPATLVQHLSRIKPLVGKKDTLQGSVRILHKDGKLVFIGGTMEGIMKSTESYALPTGESDIVVPFYSLYEWAVFQSKSDRAEGVGSIEFEVEEKTEIVDKGKTIVFPVLKAKYHRTRASFNAVYTPDNFVSVPGFDMPYEFPSVYSTPCLDRFRDGISVIGKMFAAQANPNFKGSFFFRAFSTGLYMFITDGYFMYVHLISPEVLPSEYKFHVGSKITEFPFTDQSRLTFFADKIKIVDEDIEYWQSLIISEVPDISDFMKIPDKIQLKLKMDHFKSALARIALFQISHATHLDLKRKVLYGGYAVEAGLSVNSIPGLYIIDSSVTTEKLIFSSEYVSRFLTTYPYLQELEIRARNQTNPYYFMRGDQHKYFILMPMSVENDAPDPRVLELAEVFDEHD